jgi:uncharacterized membrane protein
MGFMQAVLVLAAFLCSLVAGFLFAFAVVVMPGIRNLDDREFIKSFQVMDGIIQNSQPVFLLVWIGSIVSLLAAALLGFWQLDGVGWLLLVTATLLYLLGVHLPTVFINLPLNKQLQAQDVTSLNEQAQREVRVNFEQRWNLSNLARTGVACLTSVLLMVLLFIL